MAESIGRGLVGTSSNNSQPLLLSRKVTIHSVEVHFPSGAVTRDPDSITHSPACPGYGREQAPLGFRGRERRMR